MRKTILYNTMDTCRDTGPGVPGHVFEDNSDVPLLEPEGRFWKQAQYRLECRMAAIEVEANRKIGKSLIGRSRPTRGDYVPGDALYTAGEQVNESISRKATERDPQESSGV